MRQPRYLCDVHASAGLRGRRLCVTGSHRVCLKLWAAAYGRPRWQVGLGMVLGDGTPSGCSHSAAGHSGAQRCGSNASQRTTSMAEHNRHDHAEIAAPHGVPLPISKKTGVDPVASLIFSSHQQSPIRQCTDGLANEHGPATNRLRNLLTNPAVQHYRPIAVRQHRHAQERDPVRRPVQVMQLAQIVGVALHVRQLVRE